MDIGTCARVTVPALIVTAALLPARAGAAAPVSSTGQPCTIVVTSENGSVHGTPGRDVICVLRGTHEIFAGGGDDVVDLAVLRTLDYNTAYGGAGDDVLLGGKSPVRLYGGPGDDRLVGGPSWDHLMGNDGDDVIEGGTGSDTMNGGADQDRLYGGAGQDRLDGGSGHDVLRGGDDLDILRGGRGAFPDTLYGEGGDDSLFGGKGDDMLLGGDGDDTMSGGPGADTYDGGPGSDWVWYGGRTQPVHASIDGTRNDGKAGERDRIGATVENLQGGSGNDRLTGSAAGNDLRGGRGDDRLRGLAGPDRLEGGDGTDTCDTAPEDIATWCEATFAG